MFLSAILDLRS